MSRNKCLLPSLLLAATLTWTNPAPSPDQSAPNFNQVERKSVVCSDTAGAWTILSSTVPPVLAPATTTYVDSTAVNNQPYCYRVLSIYGGGSSGYSNLAPFAPPPPPSGAVAK